MEYVKSLQRRVKAIEEKRHKRKEESHRLHRLVLQDDPPQAEGKFACMMLTNALSHGFTATRFVRCAHNYYDQTLEQRRSFLRAPHINHLTKSIVLENIRHHLLTPSSNIQLHDENNTNRHHPPRYVCCVIPYSHKINSEALRHAIIHQVTHTKNTYSCHSTDGTNEQKMGFSARHVNYRLTDDCKSVTGYVPNAVTPLNLKTQMPIVLDITVANLDPPHFWLGGGEISLKWHVFLSQFLKSFNPIIAPISTCD